LYNASQLYLRTLRPVMIGYLAKLLYAGRNVRIGKRFRADGLPRILVDAGARVEIGDDVEFRSGVELRAHGASRMTIQSSVRIDRGVRILAANHSQISIGSRARIGLYSVLNGGDSITVGDNALISGFVYLQTSMHAFKSREVAIRDQGYEHAPVILGDGSWLGAHVVVMPGITVGPHAVVGSNAVVTQDVPGWEIVVGVPAKSIRSRG